MDREDYLETLSRQFSEEVREAFIESEHHDTFDFAGFQTKVHAIWVAARSGGLSPDRFRSILTDVTPEYAGRLSL